MIDVRQVVSCIAPAGVARARLEIAVAMRQADEPLIRPRELAGAIVENGFAEAEGLSAELSSSTPAKPVVARADSRTNWLARDRGRLPDVRVDGRSNTPQVHVSFPVGSWPGSMTRAAFKISHIRWPIWRSLTLPASVW